MQDLSLWVKFWAAITVQIFVMIKFYEKKSIEHKFNALLKKYEHDLSLITEKARFDYSRKSQDFNLWTVKRHEAYATLYSTIASSVSHIFHMRGVTFGDDYNKYDKEHIKLWMKDRNYLDVDIDNLLSNWESDKHNVLLEFQKTARSYKNNLAFNSYSDANNALVDARIYISDNLFEITDLLIKNLGKLYFSYNADFSNEQMIVKEDSLRKDIEDQWDKLAPIMRSELSGGFYENIKPPQ